MSNEMNLKFVVENVKRQNTGTLFLAIRAVKTVITLTDLIILILFALGGLSRLPSGR